MNQNLAPSSHFDLAAAAGDGPVEVPQFEAPEVAAEPTPEELIALRIEKMYERIVEAGGPNKNQIEYLKQQAPGGRLRAFSLDNKTFFLVRGISGLELTAIQKNIPAGSTNPEADTQVAAAVLCTLWTNATQAKKLDETGLRTGPAGRPSSIFTLIMSLSDYADPEDFQVCSVEL